MNKFRPMREIEQKILGFIAQQPRNNLLTLDQIANGIGYQSRGSVHRYVSSLIKQGFLDRDQSGLHLTGKPEAPFVLPFKGRIAAGRAIEAIEDSQELDVTGMFAGANRYVLVIAGDSMIDAGIHDGDYVIIQHQETANNGDIVVALIDESEATLKRYYTISDNRIRLIPENTSMEPMNYSADRIRIQGKLVGVLRTY